MDIISKDDTAAVRVGRSESNPDQIVIRIEDVKDGKAGGILAYTRLTEEGARTFAAAILKYADEIKGDSAGK